jgi:hypothetical protein
MSLRIISETSARNLERGLHTGRDIGGDLQDTYMTRMSKLVPGEAITAYPVFLNTVQADATTGARPWKAVLLVAAVVLIVVLVLRWSATKGPDGKAQWPAVIVSGISFMIWVLVMATDADFKEAGIALQAYFSVSLQLVAALLMFMWTAIAPAIYTGDAV